MHMSGTWHFARRFISVSTKGLKWFEVTQSGAQGARRGATEQLPPGLLCQALLALAIGTGVLPHALRRVDAAC